MHNDTLSPRLDFALFKKDLAVTFFRKEGSAGKYRPEDGQRFRAIFKIGDPAHPNNELIQKQRKIWVALIAQAWVVSKQFWAIVERRLSVEEKQQIQTEAYQECHKLKEKTKEDLDDDYFPLVVDEKGDLVPKLKRLNDWYNRFRPLALTRVIHPHAVTGTDLK